MKIDLHTIYTLIFKVWRKKRFARFRQIIRPEKTETLLDVGGHPDTWTAQEQPVARIDLLNVYHLPWKPGRHPAYRLQPLVGDGCALPFAEGTYDIGFSNSVIEHVGTWERQQQFAAEIRRVAKRLWVQTPAWECPVEPHYLTPFIHYLPRALQKKIIRHGTVRGWLERPSQQQIDGMVEETRLLRKKEMHQLFPDCEILTERLFGLLPKSYIAVRQEKPASPRAPAKSAGNAPR